MLNVLRGLTVVAFVSLVAVAFAADGQAKPPVLTSEQKKDIQLAAKDVELWQLRAQQAATEFDKARTALQKLVASLTPDGYVMTERLDLVPEPAREPSK